MDTFFANANTKQLILIGFDKYYARMLELEGLDLGMKCEKFSQHFNTDEVQDAVKNSKKCCTVVNSDIFHNHTELFALVEFLSCECDRTAVISTHRVHSDISKYISEDPQKLCLFKRPVLTVELLSFLCGENETVLPKHTEKISIKISHDTRSVGFSGNIIYFTEKEFEVLQVLLNADGTPVSRKDIFKSVWENDGGDSNISDVYIRYIRKKFAKYFDFDIIKTERGIGYAVNTDIIWNWKL